MSASCGITMRKNIAIASIGVLFASGIGIIALLVCTGDQADSKSLLLPVLAISSVCLLLAALSVVSVAFAAFGLNDRTQALALPEGSIRAVIALSLIVLFAILAIYLYHGSAKGEIETLKHVPIAQHDSLIAALQQKSLYVAEIPEDKDSFAIVYRNAKSPASDDLAKQLIVLLGTLVTAVSSFYFGSRATAPSSNVSPDTQQSSPTITAIVPAKAPPDSTSVSLTVSGKGLGSTAKLSLVFGANSLPATSVKATDTVVTGVIDITNAPKGQWDVVAVDVSGQSARLPAAFTI